MTDGLVATLTGWLRRAEGLRARPRLMAILAGLLLGFAQPPFGFLPGLFGYALLMWLLEGDTGPRPYLNSFIIAWIAGFFYFLVGCFWVAEAFLVFADTYGWMAPFAATLLPGGIALFWGLFAIAYRKLTPKGAYRFLLFAVLFTLFEILRGMILTGFPWNPAGATWRAGGAMSQVASWAGVYGLSFITVAAFCSLAVVRGKGWRDRWPVLVSAAVVLVCLAGGEVRLLTAKVTPTGYIVRVVQPAVGQKEKWSLGAFEGLFDDYVKMSRAPATGNHPPDLIVWPEGALPPPLEELVSDPWVASRLSSMLDDKQAFIMGVSRGDVEDGHRVWRNSMMVSHQDGDHLVIDGFYNKFKLVPFGEFTPFQMLARRIGFKPLTHFDNSFTPGTRTRATTLGRIPRFLPLICYEGIFPALDMHNYTASGDPARPRWILNVSNDAWFGPTSGPPQHLNLASYRAIEEGLPMVRSTPTGISGMIDPYGRLVSGTEIATGHRGWRDLNLLNPGKVTFFSMTHGLNLVVLVFFCLILAMFETCVAFIKKTQSPAKPERGRGEV